jgi:flagellar motor switch protein FliN/FliY
VGDQLSQEMIDSLLNNRTASGGNGEVKLTNIEIDALGESVNISMGAAAKVLSTMLNMKVIISTPKVTVTSSESFEYKNLFPAVGVQIKYIQGLSGTNFFVMKQTDVRSIVDIMMGSAFDSGNEFNELYTSAASEIMNQMMGASSTSLATFYNRKINISTPECFMLEENTDAKNSFSVSGEIVVIKMSLKIGEVIDSEFINIMPVGFAKELAENLINVQLPMQSKKIADESPDEVQRKNGHQNNESGSSSQQVTGMKKQGENYSPLNFVNFTSKSENKKALSNLGLIMDVPLEVTVQIGKTNKQVKEIIELTQGSIIELEKQAGDPVDIIVNGELIARGDVVVIDDNFGVRITEIVNSKIDNQNGVY